MFNETARVAANKSYRWVAAILLLVAIGSAVIVVVSRRRPQRWPDAVTAATAIADTTCLSCHSDKASFESTAHRLTTRLPTRDAINGSFARGENVLRTTNSALHFRMDADSSGFYETAVVRKGADSTSRTERIAIVAGSGRKGQSFLYWAGDRLFQLPISYWGSLNKWINSPGPAYIDGSANFEREVAPRCLECHATYIEWVPDLRYVNRFKHGSAVLGITCERCHGSAQEHVARERSIFHAVRSPMTVNPARLTRERQMEACGQCHGGLGEPRVPSFTYVAGKELSEYLFIRPQPSDATVDVHGNQVALLSRSKCFASSQMTCLTCHDVHKTQRDVTALSGKCLTCHTEQSCGLFPARGHALAGKCVDCHMPLQTSNLIVSSLEGTKERVQVRSHWIKVYPDSAR